MRFKICDKNDCSYWRYGIRNRCSAFKKVSECYEYRYRNEWRIWKFTKKVLRKIGRLFFIY